MMNNHTQNRINYLEKEFSDSHLNSKELVTHEYKNYSDNERLKIVDDVLHILNSFTAKLLEDEVYYLVKNNRLKDLCSICDIEVIIAVLVLFVWRSRSKSLKLEDTKIWKTYDLNWKIYAMVLNNLLIKMRENSRI